MHIILHIDLHYAFDALQCGILASIEVNYEKQKMKTAALSFNITTKRSLNHKACYFWRNN